MDSTLAGTLVKRHGTHVHAHKALIVLGICLALLAVYSAVAVAYGRLRKPFARRFTYPSVPGWLVVLLGMVILAYGFTTHRPTSQFQFARRSGRLSLAAAVFSVFLSARPAYLPRTYAVPLVLLHKWVGRTSVALAVIHGVVYCYNYIVRGSEMHHKLFSLYNVLGMVAAAAMVLMVATSFKTVRRRAYKLFYGVHVPAAWVVFVLMIWHARPSAIVLVSLGIGMMVFQLGIRIAFTHTVIPTSVHWFGPRLCLVTLPPQNRDSIPNPGSYLRISRPLRHPLAWIESTHPYTVASLPSDSETKLVVRRTRFSIEADEPLGVRGPFAAPFDANAYSKVVVFAGGSGLAIAPPIMRSHSAARLIWATRSRAETTILGSLGVEACDVYLTSELRSSGAENDEEIELDSYQISDEIDEPSPDSGLLPPSKQAQGTGIREFHGRPLLSTAVGDFLAPGDGQDACVVACGPASLVQDARLWAHFHGHSFYAESFEL